MNRAVGIIGILLLTTTAFPAEQATLVRVTTYWHAEGQLRAASNGARLRDGHCAVDPKKIPYGSRVLLANKELVAVDTGPAVVNRKAARLSGRTAQERNALVVDCYFETRAQALAWQKSHPHFMSARVFPPGRASRVAEKGKARRENPPPQIAVAAPRVTEAPKLTLVPARLGSFDFRVGLDSSSNLGRNARRRTGGELPAGIDIEST